MTPYPGPVRPAWSLHGQPLPPGTIIAVERISGPLFLVGAGRDSLLASAASAKGIALRLKTRHRHDFTTLPYKDAGRLVGLMVPNVTWGPGYTHSGAPHTYGGTLAANADVRADSWPRLLTFLKHL